MKHKYDKVEPGMRLRYTDPVDPNAWTNWLIVEKSVIFSKESAFWSCQYLGSASLKQNDWFSIGTKMDIQVDFSTGRWSECYWHYAPLT